MSDLVVAYLLAIASCTGTALFLPGALIAAYVFSGICVSRYIGRRVIWWNRENNIKNVAAIKLQTVITWPTSVPIFIVQVFIAKFL